MRPCTFNLEVQTAINFNTIYDLRFPLEQRTSNCFNLFKDFRHHVPELKMRHPSALSVRARSGGDRAPKKQPAPSESPMSNSNGVVNGLFCRRALICYPLHYCFDVATAGGNHLAKFDFDDLYRRHFIFSLHDAYLLFVTTIFFPFTI